MALLALVGLVLALRDRRALALVAPLVVRRVPWARPSVVLP